jgi:hypothetical protein
MVSMRSPMMRRSASIWVSPGPPRKPKPPRWRSRCDEVGEFDLQAPFPRPRAPAEDLENESGAIEHLGSPCRLEIALLHRGERMIDDDEPGLLGAHEPCELLDFA